MAPRAVIRTSPRMMDAAQRCIKQTDEEKYEGADPGRRCRVLPFER